MPTTKKIFGEATMGYVDVEGDFVKLGATQDVEMTFDEEEADGSPSRINTLEDAARYAYGLSETRKEIAKIEAIASSEILRWQEKIEAVEDWRDEVLKPLNGKLEHLTALLMTFHINEFENAPNEKAQAKLKSIKLPYGVTLSSTQRATQIEVTDEAALLSYAKENGFVETPEPKAKWSDIKDTLVIRDSGSITDSNGEVVEFVRAVPQERKFVVK